ncbi:acetylornithine deacetylase [Klebsiella michiganensis]|uniref:Acetylornithine deacetylase n=1 Tax=Klebsiella michiganensis TaxID=1134687 RepID=A0A7H4LSL2_9ENTR|nr:acetylornithine deacetylase [Klebsiella michiganensis]
MAATLELARQLLGFNTINPPGSEADCMRFFADWLNDRGFAGFAVVVRRGTLQSYRQAAGAKTGKPLAFTGHLDTVPLGNARWQYDPFGSQIEDGRLYGRGSSDMKAAIAAFAVACVHQRETILAGRGAVLLITGGEETGCDGARALIASATLPDVGALIVGEPTANYPAIGHKGALWLRCETRGKTAHGAMPELGINAIYLAADALGKIQHFSPGAAHPLMKQPTLNVGRIEGGLNINSVPDRTRFDVDIRSAPNLQHATIRQRLTTLLGESVTVSTLVDLPAVLSREDHAWIKQVYQRCQPLHAKPIEPRVVPYFTDASLLLPALADPPCIILGPGEPSMAHQTDEYCLLSRLEEAEQLYGDIIRDWMRSRPRRRQRMSDSVTLKRIPGDRRLNNIAE